MSTEQNKALARRVTEEGLNQQNPALVDELCAPNFVFHNGSRTIHGLPREGLVTARGRGASLAYRITSPGRASA